jgi:hypothetical protein
LRLTVSQSVTLGVEPHLGPMTRYLATTIWQLRSWFCGAPSPTRGRVCLLYMLLGLPNAVFLGSESLGTRDHILVSQIWDFPFRRLLQLAGSRWRYSTPPPHGLLPGGGGYIALARTSPYCCEGVFTLSLLCNGHGTQKTSYAIVTSLAAWRADCCLATRNNIRNSIVACVYSVARSVALQYTLQYTYILILKS